MHELHCVSKGQREQNDKNDEELLSDNGCFGRSTFSIWRMRQNQITYIHPSLAMQPTYQLCTHQENESKISMQ